MTKEKGFSLIELLIVVAIILIIAAIAIPDLLRSRMAANESAATGNLRTANTAAFTFQTSISGVGGFPAQTVSDWGQVVDPALAAAFVPGSLPKQGYLYVYTPIGTAPAFTSYNITAAPATFGSTGRRSFCTDQSGSLRWCDTDGCVGTLIVAGLCTGGNPL